MLEYLCDPIDKSVLSLERISHEENGNIIEGNLVSEGGRHYPIRNGVPRFVEHDDVRETVNSFGDEWNVFNFDHFQLNWLNHTVKNTFGSLDVFRGKVIVDAGAGSGMQSVWMREAGANLVIALELSHSVDGIMQKNIQGIDNIEVVQCSIDMPPIKDGSIDGMVYCHNVIQHTPSVKKTSEALWKIVGKNGEFVFNCYGKNDLGFIRTARFYINGKLRNFLSKRSFKFLLYYSRVMALIRFVPLIGFILEKSNLMYRGDVPKGEQYLKRAYKAGLLNTFDWFGSHHNQHYMADEDIKTLIKELQPDTTKIKNLEKYFLRPVPIGCALRLFK